MIFILNGIIDMGEEEEKEIYKYIIYD